MYLHDFTRHYNLHLLPVSHHGIELGNLVWKPFLGAPKHNHPGMPNHILNALLDAELINKTEWQNQLNQIKTPICDIAELANSTIDKVGKVAGSMLDKLGLGFEYKHMQKAKLANICARIMSNNTRTVLDNYLEQISPKQMRLLFRNPRKVHLITELYYGNITIQVEKKYQTSFEQLISDAKWPIKLSLDAHNNFEYTFKHNDVPFACRMERVHRFNG